MQNKFPRAWVIDLLIPHFAVFPLRSSEGCERRYKPDLQSRLVVWCCSKSEQTPQRSSSPCEAPHIGSVLTDSPWMAMCHLAVDGLVGRRWSPAGRRDFSSHCPSVLIGSAKRGVVWKFVGVKDPWGEEHLPLLLICCHFRAWVQNWDSFMSRS